VIADAQSGNTRRSEDSQGHLRIGFVGYVFFGLAVAFLVALQTAAQAQNADEPFLPETPFNYSGIELPEHYLENGFGEGVRFQNAAVDNDNTPESNPTTDHGATLGRVLFYDKKLSANQTTSCASCHVQATGFASPVTVGFDGETTRRHTMSLTNARFYQRGRFFWDERAETLEYQVIQPFQDPIEMGLTLESLIEIIGSQPYYETLFGNAFGDSEPTAVRISMALAQFVRSIVSVDARYDQGREMVSSPFSAFENFSALENDGKSLFFTTGCSSCHVSEAFVNVADGPTNNGLDAESIDDLGAFETFDDEDFLGTFKVPSLRNVELTGPYMHDGRFDSLEEVVEHYSSGVQQDHPNLGLALFEPESRRVGNKFSSYQKQAFVAFLKTLTDEVLLTTERLSDPFVARAGSNPVGDAARSGSAEAVDENGGVGPGIYVAVLAAVFGLFTVVNLLSNRKEGGAGSD
jgi:cytochrome c peroxidase